MYGNGSGATRTSRRHQDTGAGQCIAIAYRHVTACSGEASCCIVPQGRGYGVGRAIQLSE
jgi:hypothetical protein